MRFALPLVFGAVVTTCDSTVRDKCNCPGEGSSVSINFQCVPTQQPNLVLTGPCMAEGESLAANGVVVPNIVGTGGGTCHATLTVDGESYSTDITFAQKWYACGSDPHGCGSDFEADSLTWRIYNNACYDAGAAADGAPE